MQPLPDQPGPKSPGELYMAFGPAHRVVKVAADGPEQIRLVHVCKGEDGLWRQHCPHQDHAAEDPEGSLLYAALRRLIDGCSELVELEP